MPTIDIALAAYNGEKYISEQISSILTCKIDVEGFSLGSIIVSDNMSSDGTAKIVMELAKQHPQVKLVTCTQPGIISNFNCALQHTNAEYIMLSDQDDFWLENKIQRSIEELIKLESQAGKDVPLLVFSDLHVTDRDLNITDQSFFKAQKLIPDSYLYPKHIFLANVAPGCTMIFNRKLLDLALPVPTTAAMHDWWLLLIASTFGKVSHIDEATILYRQHGNNQVGAPTKRYRAMLLSPLKQFQLAGARLGQSEKQAYTFRKKFPEHPLRCDDSLNFMADFSNLSRLKRVLGLINKKIEHRTKIKKIILFLLALSLPERRGTFESET